jgi:hypothetical protein
MKSIFFFIYLFVLINLTIPTVFAQQLQHPTGLSANSNTMVSRAPDSRGWTDPALNHNKLLQQRTGEGTLIVIGNFKVKGSPFLYGGMHKGNVFSATEKAWNIIISYNTYNQELEFLSTSNPTTPYVKEPGELDSFVIQKDMEAGIISDLKFVYGQVLGSKEKQYFQEVCAGASFNLYKAYKSKLGFVSNNYTQPDLRQFDLEYDYYYSTNDKKGLKKLKANSASIVKEFQAVKDLGSIVTAEAFTLNQNETLRKAFEVLNQ